MNHTDRYLTEAEFSEDHWSTLAYIETVMVESGGFQVGCDPRMRQNRRNHRVMTEGCRNPKRSCGRGGWRNAAVMDLKYSTILPSGEIVDGHDDWCCVQDMANAGYFTVGADEIEPGVVLHLSERGRVVAEAIRRHKSDGNNFASFQVAA